MLKNRREVPLSRQRFIACSVPLCSGHNIRYSSNLAIPYYDWHSRRMRGEMRNVVDGIDNLLQVEGHGLLVRYKQQNKLT